MAKKHTAKELEQFIELYLDGVPFRELCSEYGLRISVSSFNMYFLNYKAYGPSALEDLGITEFTVSEIEMIPQSEVTLEGDDLRLFERMINALEDNEDVQKVYHNVNLED